MKIGKFLKSAMVGSVGALVLMSGCGKEQGTKADPVRNPPGKVGGGVRALPVTFEGKEKNKKCRITFHREWQEGDAVGKDFYRVEVSTSYQHHDDGLGKVTLAFSADGDGKILQWENKDSDQHLRVALKEPAEQAQEPTSFRVRWLHGDHHHDNTCTDLQAVTAK